MNYPASAPDAALAANMIELGARARASASELSKTQAETRTAALLAMAAQIRSASDAILAANEKDMSAGEEKGLSSALLDRLSLTGERVEAIATGIEAIAALPDPIGEETARWTVPSGLDIARVRTPLGVIGIIYESRPNVTADAAALCIRSGNAAILRGGSESLHSSGAIGSAIRAALKEVGLPEDAVQLVPTTDRAAVGHILSGLEGTIDVVVPRGGKGLCQRVQDEARIPVIGHLEGICHTYVDGAADLQMAIDICVNAKLRRTGICGSMETLLIDGAKAGDLLAPIASALADAGCTLKGDDAARAIIPEMEKAVEADWSTEYLDTILSVKIVDGVAGAIDHISAYGTSHTEAIITEDASIAERFFAEVDSAIVMHNTSTQFADGGQFGMGAEIGIATGRIHARGPVGAEQLTIFKYVVRGSGQTRP